MSMTREDFIQKLGETEELTEVDALCFDWLREAATNYPTEMWAGKLLNLAEEMMQ